MGTDFPNPGDDGPVSLRRSGFARFDAAYALDLQAKHPDVWKLGSNVKQSAQFPILCRVHAQGGVAKTKAEEAAVRLREQWAAQHFDDEDVDGVVNQIKWLVVGKLGEAAMKTLVQQTSKHTAIGHTTAPEDGNTTPNNETKDMSDAVRTKDATGRSAAPDAGGAVPGPSRLCVRAAVVSAVREDAREVDFICSSEAVDSYDEIVRQNWNLRRFQSNPVALWSHQSHLMPVGHWPKVGVEGGALKGTLKVATAAANPLAEQAWQSILEKNLRAVSVGFLPGKVSYEEIDGREVCVLDDNELFEISLTPIPANPEALVDLKAKALEAYRSRAAVPYQAFPPVSSEKWDASAAVTRIRKWASSDGSGSSDHIDWVKYRQAFAWMDPQLSHAFAGFKLPHHDVVDGKLVTVRAGVIAAGDALSGSRGGVKIPAADVEGVKAHLAKHYHQFDLKAPWEADGDKSTSAPKRGTNTTKEAHVATIEELKLRAAKGMVTCPNCDQEFDPEDDDGDDDDEEKKAKKAANRGAMKKRHGSIVTERDTATGKVADLEKKNAEMAKRLIEAELTPLSGQKFAPAEMEGHMDLALHYLSQGTVGTEKWKKHLEGLRARPDLTTLGGSSVLPKDTTQSGLTTSAATGGNELAALVNDEAARLG